MVTPLSSSITWAYIWLRLRKIESRGLSGVPDNVFLILRRLRDLACLRSNFAMIYAVPVAARLPGFSRMYSFVYRMPLPL